MESIVLYFSELGIDFWGMLKVTIILLAGVLVFSSVLRFIFGKKTLLGLAISSSITIVFIYLVMGLILSLAPSLHWIVTPLPFAAFSADSIHFYTLQGSVYTTAAAELLSMIILALLVNIIDGWMPRGKHIISWLLWRCVTVVLGLILNFAVAWLFNRYLPQGIVTYAPVILLVVLLVMLLTGALRLVVGLILTTINPVIAALYTFFFATIIGKQVTKSVMTTGIVVGLIYLLEHFGIVALSLAAPALIAYIPFLLLLIVVWYVVNRFL